MKQQCVQTKTFSVNVLKAKLINGIQLNKDSTSFERLKLFYTNPKLPLYVLQVYNFFVTLLDFRD